MWWHCFDAFQFIHSYLTEVPIHLRQRTFVPHSNSSNSNFPKPELFNIHLLLKFIVIVKTAMRPKSAASICIFPNWQPFKMQNAVQQQFACMRYATEWFELKSTNESSSKCASKTATIATGSHSNRIRTIGVQQNKHSIYEIGLRASEQYQANCHCVQMVYHYYERIFGQCTHTRIIGLRRPIWVCHESGMLSPLSLPLRLLMHEVR